VRQHGQQTRPNSIDECTPAQWDAASARHNLMLAACRGYECPRDGDCPEHGKNRPGQGSGPLPEFPPHQADGTINPKDAAALKRVPMHLLPPVGVAYGAMACLDGARKYGPYNWRERPISLTQYVGAMQRHLAALLDGEDCAQDSKLPHLAHIVATAAILLDAQNAGALLDDRPKRSGRAGSLIQELNLRIARELDGAREVAK
jgi:hypothetical protein